MDNERVREICLAMPNVVETLNWGHVLCYWVGDREVGGKMFAVTSLEPRGVSLSFKCSPEEFAELTERSGIVPAPYSARMHWVALEAEDALPRAEIKRLVRLSYDLVVAKLPKKGANIWPADERRWTRIGI